MASVKEEDRDSVEANDVGHGSNGWSKKLNRTSQAFWDPSKKEFIGRTWQSWAKIGVFYVIFYSCLACFFAIMLAGFFTTVDNEQPTQQNLQSLLKSNPGMAFRPMPNIESTLIKFKQGVPDSYKIYTDNLNGFFKEYYKQEGSNVINCTRDTNGEELAKEGNVCRAGKSMFGEECTSENSFGFNEGTPCIMLKINKVFGWMPKPFAVSSDDDENSTVALEARKKLGDTIDQQNIKVTCEGENDADIDNMGKIRFFPEKGFSMAFYPYRKLKNYRQPVLFVKFDNPKPGVLIQVWCRIWTLNIKHHKNDKAGSIHFELLID